MKFKIIISSLALSILLYACNGNNAENAASEGTPAVTATHGMEVKGQIIFEQRCASCHGSDGAAGIGNAADLQLSKLDSVALSATITDGKGTMPSFKQQLTKEEITEISNYIITLRK